MHRVRACGFSEASFNELHSYGLWGRPGANVGCQVRVTRVNKKMDVTGVKMPFGADHGTGGIVLMSIVRDFGKDRPFRVLFANHHFWRYTGSEIHTIQLAEHFLEKGAEVTLFGVTSEPWLVGQLKDKGIKVATRRELLGKIDAYFDLVWTHHETQFFLLHTLLGIDCRQAIHGILSYRVRLERMPIVPQGQGGEKLRLLANSVETRDAAAQASGLRDIGVLLNIVPDSFRSHEKIDYSPVLRRIAVVSNHVPSEIIEAKSLLCQKGVEVELFGQGYRYVLIDHQTLVGFDVVVTIGKTAQYAIAQGIPLFLYDIFGGPGYIHEHDFSRHEDYNYSGRSHPYRMSAEEICDTLIHGYPKAAAAARSLREICGDRYRVGPQTGQIISKMAPSFSPLFSRRARLRNALSVAIKRPSVLIRLAFPRAVDKVGRWLRSI